jgi:glutaryl-CoA dehydrogenase
MARAAVTDLYRLDELLTPDQRAMRDSVARLVDREVLPEIGSHFRAGTFPPGLVPRLAEVGVLGGTLEGYGCPGLSHVGYGLALQELERGDSGLRSFASVQSSLSMFPIHAFGSEEQRQRFLPAMARGTSIGCFGLTEASAGSDPGALTTRARRDGPDFILDGAKLWITNGTLADVAVVWAKVDDGDARSIRGFLVEKGMPGFVARELQGKLSLRTSATAELSFQGVRVPAANVLPGVQGLKGPFSCLHRARMGIAFAVMGAAVACFESAREYALGRMTFGRPIGGTQLIQEKLADMLEELVKGQLLGWRLLSLADQHGAVSPEQVSLAKRNNVRAALAIARSARAILGANGITDEFPPLRHALNLESVLTYEGTHEVHTLVVGKAITGLDAF